MDSVKISLEEVIYHNNSNEEAKSIAILLDLHSMAWKTTIDSFAIKIDKNKKKYTPMQFAARYGLTKMAESLLDDNADPNFCGFKECKNKGIFNKIKRKDSTNMKSSETMYPVYKTCRKPPLLLAAKHGHHEILKLFKYHGDTCNKSTPSSSIQFSNERSGAETSKFLETRSSPNVSVDFDVVYGENRQSVLHIVLEQPLLEKKRKEERIRNIMEENETPFILNPRKENQKSVINPKILVLKERTLQELAGDYRKCMNVLLDMDKFKSKTTRNKKYPKQIREIINHKDNKKNTPLHYAASNWPSQVVEKLMSLGANPSLRNRNGEIPLANISKSTFENFLDKRCIIVEDFDPSDNEMEEDGDKDDSAQNIAQDYDQRFMMKINSCGRDKGDEMTIDFGFLSPRKDKILTNEVGPEAINSITSDIDVEKNRECEKAKESEMNVLWEMSRSEQHRSLICHPVIESFLWAKWKLMTKFNNRMLRLRFLFMYCILWYTFATFGGYGWMSITFGGNNTRNPFDNRAFCNETKSNPELTTIWNQEQFRLSSMWYYFFILVTLLQLILILRDYGSDSYDQVASWIDLVNMLLSISILVFGDTVLWIVITLLLLFYSISEITEVIAVGYKYFGESSNHFDMSMIIFTFIVLYLPQEKIGNPTVFSIFNNRIGSGCRVKRSMSALVIVLVWSRFLMSLAKCAFLKKYNLYLIMFSKVIKTYGKIMLWFVCYIFAFGLGFYIALHGDTEERAKSKSNNDESFCVYNKTSLRCVFPEKLDTSKFDNPFLALIKTGTMFMGEIDFDDLPMHGGNLSVSIAYIFLIAFIFVIVIVMVNLLNGLAVSDTQKILIDSTIESQISVIETIRYFESVYLDTGKLSWYFGNKKCFNSIKFFGKYVKSMKLSLFKSRFITDNTLIMPLKNPEDEEEEEKQEVKKYNWWKSSYLKIKYWFLRTDENYGSERFLCKARKVLIRLKKAKETERKQTRLEKEIDKIEEQRKSFEQIRNNAYRDQIQNIENKLDFLVSKLSNEYD